MDNKSFNEINGTMVYSPDMIKELDYDKIVISTKKRDHILKIKDQLQKLGVPDNKIEIFMDNSNLIRAVFSEYNRYDEKTDLRVGWIRELEKYFRAEEIDGAVAECGVNRGEFAFFINKYFPERDLYLFDTFLDFDERDLAEENRIGDKAFVEGAFNDKYAFSVTSEDIVLSRMLHPEKCVIK